MDRKKKLKEFGLSLKEKRMERGMTVRDLEAQTGIDNSVISKYENGEQNPALLTLLKIAEGLNLSVSELLAGL